jgi:hypothetical protein
MNAAHYIILKLTNFKLFFRILSERRIVLLPDIIIRSLQNVENNLWSLRRISLRWFAICRPEM